jgi:hypothetical protein
MKKKGKNLILSFRICILIFAKLPILNQMNQINVDGRGKNIKYIISPAIHKLFPHNYPY